MTLLIKVQMIPNAETMTELKPKTLLRLIQEALMQLTTNKTSFIQIITFITERILKKKGKYKITFYYSTNEPGFKYWMGDPYAGQRRYWFDSKTGEILQQYKDEYQTLLSLFSKVPQLDLISNELLIEVK